jgi:hypothetical protein
MRAVGSNFAGGRPGEKPAHRTRMARPGGDIIGVEQEREAVIERHVGGREILEQELLEEPCRVRAMPFGRTCIRHRLHDLILIRQGRGAPLGFRAHAKICVAPEVPAIMRNKSRPRIEPTG